MDAKRDPPAGMGAAAGNQGQPVPDAPPLRASLPVNKSPEWVMDVLYEGVYFFQSYGWFIVFGALFLYFLWTRVRDRFFALWDEMNARQEARSVDPAVLAARQEAMSAARARLQQDISGKAAEYAQKQKEIEERKRQERIEDWERQQTGRGPRSRTLRSSAKDEEKDQQSGKPRRRPLKPDSDYSPLMGSGGGGGYRPSRSRPGGAGGG